MNKTHTFNLFIVLFATWLIFSGFFNLFFIVAGALSCAFAVYIAHRMDVVDHESHFFHLTMRTLGYWVWIAKEIILSSLAVTRIVWQAKPIISPAIAWIPANQKSDVGKAVYANSITLTPGTVCIDVKDDMLEVHTLTHAGLDDLNKGEMGVRVRNFIIGEDHYDIQK